MSVCIMFAVPNARQCMLRHSCLGKAKHACVRGKAQATPFPAHFPPPSPPRHNPQTYLQGTDPSAFGLQVHDQRSAMTEEEEAANQVWLDGRAPPQEGPGLESQARHMIQNQRQYYDEVHVIKEQVQQPSITLSQTAALFPGLGG